MEEKTWNETFVGSGTYTQKDDSSYSISVSTERRPLSEEVLIARIWGGEGENPYYCNKEQIKEDLDRYFETRLEEYDIEAY